jgi:hypothetical protein
MNGLAEAACEKIGIGAVKNFALFKMVHAGTLGGPRIELR